MDLDYGIRPEHGWSGLPSKTAQYLGYMLQLRNGSYMVPPKNCRPVRGEFLHYGLWRFEEGLWVYVP